MFEERLALIVDGDPRSSKTAKEALESLCDDKVQVISSLTEARKLIETKRILFMMVDLNIDAIETLNFIKWLRKNTDNPNYKLPLVLITPKSTPESKLNEVINAGVTEYLLKPFSASQLKDMIISILRNPRNFIVAEQYVGPDRRKRNNNTQKKDKRQ
jgi:DNA-binding response OmpR family regulator